MIEQIKKLHEEMKDIVIKSGIQEAQYKFPMKRIEKKPEIFLQIFLEWLIKFKNTEYANVKKLLDQFSGWDNYHLLGQNSMPEQIWLKQKQKALRIAWFNRPRPPKRVKKNGLMRDMQSLDTE